MKCKAFTLAELLIALAILGVIATFTIPKVLTAQQNASWNASGKEAASVVSGAYQSYLLARGSAVGMKPSDLTPYINYVNFDTTTTVDDSQNQSTWNCESDNPCVLLHNGGRLHFEDAMAYGGQFFNGTNNTNGITISFDPDGKVTTDGSGGSPGKEVTFVLFYNGRIQTQGQVISFQNSLGSSTGNPIFDPYWFSWN